MSRPSATRRSRLPFRSEEHTSELQSPVHISPLSLHDALPICPERLSGTRASRPRRVDRAHARHTLGSARSVGAGRRAAYSRAGRRVPTPTPPARLCHDLRPLGEVGSPSDRKSTRLNSSHPSTSPPFPYTTLFRSVLNDFRARGPVALEEWTARMRATPWGLPDQSALVGAPRIRELEEEFLPQRLQRDYVTTFGH